MIHLRPETIISQPAFDWYQASIHAPEDNIIEVLVSELGTDMVKVRGIAQYDHAIGFIIPGYEGTICELSFGGNQGAVPHLKATGYFAADAAALIRTHWPHHYVSRLDSCYDFVGEGLYDEFRPFLDNCHHAHGIYRNEMGFPENGRTFYLGSPKSPVRLRCYEKDKELQGKGHDFTPGHLRLELQVRPLTREKPKFAALDAAQVWGAAKWSRLVVRDILALNPTPIKREPIMSKTKDEYVAEAFVQYARRLQDLGKDRSLELLRILFDEGTEGLSAAVLRARTDDQ